MFSLFSTSGSQGNTSGPKAIDIQLLSDAEVLKVWDQTQNLLQSQEENNLPTQLTSYYAYVIETELQLRSQQNPSIFFNILNDCVEETVHDIKCSFPKQVLSTNIVI